MAVEGKVSASTQNQAFNAILFLFRDVLDREEVVINNAVRASRGRRLPVVISREEIKQVFAELDGVHLLMARVIYGGGLRLSECVRIGMK